LTLARSSITLQPNEYQLRVGSVLAQDGVGLSKPRLFKNKSQAI